MHRFKSSILDAFNNLRRAPSMAFAIVVVSAVSLSLLGVALMINSQVSSMKGYWYDKVEVSIFLEEGMTLEAKSALEAQLNNDPLIEEVYFESKSQAFALFKEQFKDAPELTEQVTPDQLPESFRLKLVDPERFTDISGTYATVPGVNVIQDQKAVLEGFFKVLEGIQTAALVLAAIQVVTALILVSNTIRTAALARRREVKIMRLVGAPRAMIALPFILEGALAGFFGGILSSLSLVAIKVYLVDDKFLSYSQSFPLVGWDGTISAIVLTMIIGFILTAGASTLSILRHLKA